MNNKSKIGNGIGLTIIVCSIVRWFFLFYDPSQMIMGISVGVIICGFAYVYNWMVQREKEIKDMQTKIEVFSKWYASEEFK